MHDALELFLILGALYVWDCTLWIPRGALTLRRGAGLRSRVVEPAALAGNERRALVLSGLWPSRCLHVLQTEPVCFGPEGVAGTQLPTLARRVAPPPVPRLVRWSACSAACARERSVYVDGRLLAELDSVERAQRFAAELAALSNLTPNEREAALRRRLRERFDPERLATRIARFDAATRLLSWFASAAFLAVYAAFPLLAVRLGLARAWPLLALAALILWAVTFLAADRAHRDLYPARRKERRQRRLAYLVAPLSLLRARDHLARDLLLDFDPLLVIAYALPSQHARGWIEHARRDLTHPRQPLSTPSVEAQSVEAAARARYSEALARAVDVSTVLTPALDPETVAFCPRCWGEYVRSDVGCADCGELKLQPAVAAHGA